MSSRNMMVSKCLGIMAEVIGFCTQQGATTWETDVTLDEQKTTMMILAKNGNFSEKEIMFLDGQLNIPRQRDLEHMYWGLSGFSGGQTKPHLFLAGIMIDKAKVTLNDNGFKVEMVRYRQKR